MTRRGRCQCGTILQFQQGPQGFKTRCRKCGSVVRLRVDDEPTKVHTPAEPVVRREASGGLGEPFAQPLLSDDTPRSGGQTPFVEMEAWRPVLAYRAAGRRRRRLWWAAGLAVLAAGLAVLFWWLRRQATGVS